MADETELEVAESGVAGGEPTEKGQGALEADREADGSLMSRSAREEDAGGDKKGEDSGEDDNPAERVPDKPEGYELTFSDKITVDEELLASFRQTALEIGLTQGQAQKLGSLYEGHMAKLGEKMLAEHTEYLLEARKGWEAELVKSPTFEADLRLIQAALRRFGDDELYDLLDQTNLGSHPKMFSFMAKVGKALAEPNFHGSGAGRTKSAAEVLYPDMN